MGQCWTKVQHRARIVASKLKKKTRRHYYDDGDDKDLIKEFSGGNVHLITKLAEWEERISEANRDAKPVVVNFSASWCKPCRTIARTYEELADKYPSMMFLTVDVDELAEFSRSWDIKATPTFLFFRNGEHMDTLVGSNKVELQEKTMAFAGSSYMKSM